MHEYSSEKIIIDREILAADCLLQMDLHKFSPRKALKSIGINDNAPERPAVYALVQETIRRKNTLKRILHHLLESKAAFFHPKSPSISELPLFVQQIAQIGIYRALFETPRHPSALVTSSVINSLKIRKFSQWIEIIKRIFYDINQFDYQSWLNKITDSIEQLAVETFHPTWLTRSLLRVYGNSTTREILTYFNNQPPNYIRINNLKRSNNVFDELKENNYVIQKDEFCSSIYQIVRSGINKLPNLTSFKEGLFFIQARSSAYIPLMVNPQPQELILDTCASPGGKTTFLADLMQNTGKIIAIDINPDRIKELNNNLDKYGVKNTETKMIDIRNFETDERFDKILIDAPCSGTGTLASRPYARWRLSKQRVKAYFKLQLEIINAAIKFLKPEEGLLFYVTCSLLPEENEDVIKAFLENQKTNIQPVPLSFDIGSRISFYGRRLLPQVMQSEGFSIFCFKKNE